MLGHNERKTTAKSNVCKICSEENEPLYLISITQKIIRGKWKLSIIYHLEKGTKRFCKLQKEIPATTSCLAKQLKELEADGLVHRKCYQEVPPKVEYSLTKAGKNFLGVMNAMYLWGKDYSLENHNEKDVIELKSNSILK